LNGGLSRLQRADDNAIQRWQITMHTKQQHLELFFFQLAADDNLSACLPPVMCNSIRKSTFTPVFISLIHRADLTAKSGTTSKTFIHSTDVSKVARWSSG